MDSELLRQKRVRLDLAGAIANIRRRGTPPRVFQFEHGLEPGIRQQICDRFGLCEDLERSDEHFAMRAYVAVHQFVGLEFVRVFPGKLVWPGNTGPLPPAVGPIGTWADFEKYPWPRVADVDFSEFEWCERALPDEMGMTAMTYLFQKVSDLLGFEPLCMMLYEDRELVRAVTAKVAEFQIAMAETFCSFSRFAALNVGDDMGHKIGTLVSPADIREIFIPWHRRLLDVARRHGKLRLFHSCGMVDAIMDDLIDTVGIEAKHSTQDVVEPVQETKKKYGHRVALLGGVDVDVLTRASPERIRAYVRRILETCGPDGGFALGVGNWVADSMPLDNYLAMLEEARRFSR